MSANRAGGGELLHYLINHIETPPMSANSTGGGGRGKLFTWNYVNYYIETAPAPHPFGPAGCFLLVKIFFITSISEYISVSCYN